MCSICKGTTKIQLFNSIVDCDCVSVPNIQYDPGSGIPNSCGDKHWIVNGKYHREDGPAIEWANGDKWWYLNGEYLTEEEFQKRTQ